MCLVFRKAITKFVQAFLAFTSQPWDHSESGADYNYQTSPKKNLQGTNTLGYLPEKAYKGQTI